MEQMALDQLPGWDSMLGLQFKNLVLNNVPALTRSLRLGRTPLLAAAPYLQKPTRHKRGCQVDLLMPTKHALYVVEVKRRQIIGVEVIEEVQQKLQRLAAGRGRSVRTALVYQGQLDPRVEDEGFFDFLIPLERALSPEKFGG